MAEAGAALDTRPVEGPPEPPKPAVPEPTTEASPAPSDSSKTELETPREMNKSDEQRAKEVDVLGKVITEDEIRTYAEEVKGKNPEEIKKIIDADPRKKALNGVLLFRLGPSADFSADPLDVKLSLKMKEGKVTGEVAVTKIVRMDTQFAYCTVIGPGGGTPAEAVPIARNLLADAQIVASKDVLLSGLPEGQKAVVEKYIDRIGAKLLDKVQAPVGKDLDPNIEGIARDLLPNARENVEQLIENATKEQKIEKGMSKDQKRAAEKANERNLALQEELSNLVKDVDIVNPEVFWNVLDKLGGPTAIQGRLDEITPLLGPLETYAKLTPGKSPHPTEPTRPITEGEVASFKSEFDHTLAEKELYDIALEALKPGAENPVVKKIEGIQNGKVSVSESKKLVEATQNKDASAVMEAVIADEVKLAKTEDEKRKVREAGERHKRNLNRLQKAGMVSGIGLALILYMAMQGGKGGQH